MKLGARRSAAALTRGMWLGLLLILADRAEAATVCSVQTLGVAFGSYEIVVPSPTDANGSIELVCTYEPTPGGPPPLIAVYFSAGSSGNLNDRRMNSATDVLRYNLYTDPARTQIWGDGTGGTSFQTAQIRVGPGVGNATRSELFTIYGRIPPLQSVDSGTYSDTIVVTVEF